MLNLFKNQGRSLMKKAIAISAAVLMIIAFGGIIVWLRMTHTHIDNPTAEIYLNGELLKTVSLDEDCEFTIECDNGYNIIKIDNHSLQISAADCPDKVCVNTGAISGGAIPIVCLPHKLEIHIVNGEGDLNVII